MSGAYSDSGTNSGTSDPERDASREPVRPAQPPPAGAFVDDDFAVPVEFSAGPVRLEPLDPRHNEADHAAWMSSIAHIRATPGFQDRSWPPAAGMSLADNLRDLQQHADDFARRKGFTYTVIETASGEIVGCVYIYPSRRAGYDADVRSWVRADKAELDKPLHQAVSAWLVRDWPFRKVNYAPR